MVRSMIRGLVQVFGSDVPAADRARRSRRFHGGLGLEGLEGRAVPSGGYTISYGNENPAEATPVVDPAPTTTTIATNVAAMA